MTADVIIGLLGVAVTADVAAIAALGWLINFVVRLDARQSQQRAEMATELQHRMDRLEDRLR